MPDYGSMLADRTEIDIQKQLRAIYKQAANELKVKLATFNAKHKAKSAEKKALLDAGKITKAEYDSWMMGQVFIGNQWKDKISQTTEIMSHANEEAAEVIHKGKLNVFAENYNYEAYELEKATNGAVSFNLYNSESVSRLIMEKPKMLPEWKIDEPKDYKWNRQKVENSITQGIIQGEGIDDITNLLINNLCTTNENRMRLFARTGMTEAQNAGRQAQMEDAEEMGIEVKKRWVATLDDRTRDLHQELDGQEVGVDEDFHVGDYSIAYPGDPDAEPEMVYNCRCTMIQIYPGIEHKSVRRAYDEPDETGHRESYTVEDMTYKEWKEWKENGKQAVQAEEPKAEPVQNPSSGMEKVNELLQNHQGDWSTDELIETGNAFNDVIDEDTRGTREAYQESLDKVEEAKREIDELKAKVNELEDQGKYEEADQLLVDKMDDLRNKRSEAYQALYKAEREHDEAVSNAVLSRISEVREVGGVTKDNVDTFADLKAYASYHGKEVREKTIEALNHYPSDWLKASAAHQSTLKPHWTTGRAYYGWGEIRFSSNKATNIHELGHRFEHVLVAIKQAEKEFYDRRTAGEKLEWLGAGYNRKEKTRKDHFTSPYMGKDYGGSAYELVSMGFQYVFTSYEHFKKNDPEMLKWSLGLLLGVK